MATGAQMSRFYNKKNMPWDQFDTMFQAFLRQQIADAVAANMPAPFTYLPGPGTVVPVTAPSVNAISVGVTGGPYAATDGQGHIFKFTAAYGATNMASIRVPPDAGVLYGVALESCLVEDQTIEVNPRTGAFEYRNFIEDIGRVVSPSAVTWVGSTLTLTFQSTTAFEVGKDNTGRLLRVWLKSKSNGGPGPQSAIAARAFYTGALNSLNQIVLTTAGLGWVPFNQATPSTTPSDYTALIKGPTIRRQALEDLRTTPGALYLATITNVAAAFTITSINTTVQESGMETQYVATTITPATKAPNLTIVQNTSTAITTFNVPSSATLGYALRPGFKYTITFKNTSGSVAGSVSLAQFKIGAAWTNAANGFSRSIQFMWNGTNWIEIFRSAVDVAN